MKEPKSDVDEQDASELPDREAMSILDPGHLVGTMPPIPAPGPATIDGGPTPADQGLAGNLDKI
jgi:hypothetical protein